MSVLLLSTDLLFSSRVAQAARAASVDLRLVTGTDEVLQHVADEVSLHLLILDLSASDCDVQRIVTAVRRSLSPARVVAYASHVLGPVLQRARQAGCDQVLTRGQFTSRLDELMKDRQA
ncbi:MAG: hypothetical protein EA424_07940 [Planctomycetaceae bacterium]|nr:MAG: hypothetical protein EA424_07940 [Planctomycetaceae bacterium]